MELGQGLRTKVWGWKPGSIADLLGFLFAQHPKDLVLGF